MKEQALVRKILINLGINMSNVDDSQLDAFLDQETIKSALNTIQNSKEHIMKQWEITSKKIAFLDLTIHVPNGIHHKEYQFVLEKSILETHNISDFDFIIPQELGLTFNKESLILSGTAEASGDFKLLLRFKIKGQKEDEDFFEKEMRLIINPDPKSLWKNIESDKNELFWKPDNESCFLDLNDKKVVVSSKRGRSHQNVGSFRDDGYAVSHFEKTGWTVLAVSDGAGSSPFSREGSRIACNETISYFKNNFSHRELLAFEQKLQVFEETRNEELLRELEVESKKSLYKVVVHIHNTLKEIADETFKNYPEKFTNVKKNPIDYFHATLIFSVFKKFDFGYLFLTFSVGDCPIGIVSKDGKTTELLNWLDVGEFGGGTRFITEPNIFHSTERPISTRFNFHIQTDFSYLFMMTDGIYDPKFIVEANLKDNQKWVEFLNDLQGNNEDKAIVDFNDDENVAKQLDTWMDFWSRGNHDDRTLAIVY